MADFSGQLPNRDAPVIDSGGVFASAWYNFMAFLASLKATDIQPIAIGASPYAYEASSIGHLHVAAGAVTSVVLQRGGITLSCPTAGFVPMVAGDEATIIYTVAPNLNWVPEART